MSPAFHLEPVGDADFEGLLAIRIEAMRPSLERLGRFDPERARERLCQGFEPTRMRAIVVAGERVGFLTVAPEAEALRLVHFYLRPAVQGRGLGAAVLAGVIAEAEAQHRVLVVTALRDSDANRFYRRQGFEPDGEAGWDIHYRRMPRATSVEAP